MRTQKTHEGPTVILNSITVMKVVEAYDSNVVLI